MSDVKHLFDSACTGEIIQLDEGHALAELSRHTPHISLKYKLEVKLVEADLSFPAYVAKHLEGYQLYGAQPSGYCLALHFKPGKNNLYSRFLRRSLCENIVEEVTGLESYTNDQGKVILTGQLNDFESMLAHLEKLATMNAVLTAANQLLVDHDAHAVSRAP